MPHACGATTSRCSTRARCRAARGSSAWGASPVSTTTSGVSLRSSTPPTWPAATCCRTAFATTAPGREPPGRLSSHLLPGACSRRDDERGSRSVDAISRGRPPRSAEPADRPSSGRSGAGSVLSEATHPLVGFERRVLLVAAVVFAVLMVLSPWYGFDRDELYFLDAARHLQGGYVDQPVLVPLLARVSLELFGVSLPGLRLWPTLAAFATVVVSALIARELGGGRRSQLLSALAAATMPALLAIDHLDGPTAIDVLAWAALALVAIHIGRTSEPRWWLAGGAVLGVGLANKHSVGFLGAALFLS